MKVEIPEWVLKELIEEKKGWLKANKEAGEEVVKFEKWIVDNLTKQITSKASTKKKGFVRQLMFREAFAWEKEVEDLVKENMQGYTLNVPCGKCKLGDERLDIDPNMSMREAYNMFKQKLPYKNSVFDTVISDPPWKIGHYFRPRLFFELVRVCKVGGRIIYNATWIPTSKYTRLVNCFIRQSNNIIGFR